jgi:hypothetical protein
MILEPDSSNHKGYKMTLLVSPKDPKVELWEGAKCGLENAVNVFEADEVNQYYRAILESNFYIIGY